MSDLMLTMQCGCPATDTGEHRLGCWMAEAEAIATEAADAAHVYDPPRHPLIAALTALAEAGHLRTPAPPDTVLIGVLDYLVSVDQLGPAEDECDG